MFADYFSVDLIFRMLNVAVFCALTGYLIKRYGLEFVAQSMREQEQRKKELYEQQAALARERALTQRAAEEQEAFAHRLRKHVYRWQQVFGAEASRRAQEKEVLSDRLARKSAVQQQQLIARGAADHVLVRAIEAARGTLSAQFADVRMGSVFVRDIVAYLKKSSL